MRGELLRSWARRLDPVDRYGLRVTLLAVAFILVAVPFATLTYQVLDGGSLTRMDGRLANELNDRVQGRPQLIAGLKALSFLGKPIVLAIIVAAAAAYAWRREQRRVAAFLLVTSGGGGLVNSAVKLLVDRPRPQVDHPIATAWGESFPSGHSMGSTICYGALLLVFLAVIPRRRRPFAVLATAALVLAIGASRLLLGVHFLTDVVGGFALGLAWLSAATALFQVWRVETGGHRVDPLEEGLEPEASNDLMASAGPS